ncbi:MAG: helix-turn-helix domain-containing protein [Salibacteraceae bacterium]
MKKAIKELNLIDLTASFVNSTSSHIFLTGKAGTGKTTFLRNLAQKTHKSFVIVAPTGIAALNAQGVTIHSQFLFPFGTFIPDRSPAGAFGQDARFFTQHTLASKHPLNSIRKQVLRAADLIIIDEVSMLRADILDAIDYRMRSVKANFQRSFGGAQVLFIGDLFQLPPIVKDQEWNVLKNYYKSMHFFEAQALKQDPPTYIELDKIFRQEDDKFISILNNLRNNQTTEADIIELNKHYKTESDINDQEGVITLTTHNYKADSINRKKLDDLNVKSEYFEADIDGDFPEKLYPVSESLELKVGTQIMFIKNDTSGQQRFFNGKIAQVTSVEFGDIRVIMDGETDEYELKREEWENKKYTVNELSKELEEEVVGTFRQYPVKLAWAVTVHKSQGLTFDKAIIDVGQAFASGQVYVALSRLRSLDGLILRTKINTNSLSSDFNVVSFIDQQQGKERLPQILEAHQSNYLQRLLASTFDFTPIEKLLDYLTGNKKSSMEFELEGMQRAIPTIRLKFNDQKQTTIKFKNQLLHLLHTNKQGQLEERLRKGSVYYMSFLEDIQKELLKHLSEVEQLSKTKTYVAGLEEIDQLIVKTITEIEKAAYLTHCVLNGQEINKNSQGNKGRIIGRAKFLEDARKEASQNPELAGKKSGRKRVKSKTTKAPKESKKGETYKTTYALIKDGMGLKEIASTRSMALSTIEGHAVKGIQEGEVSVNTLLPKDTIEVIALSLKKSKKGIKEIYAAFNGKYSYGEIRMVQASLTASKN